MDDVDPRQIGKLIATLYIFPHPWDQRLIHMA